MRHSILFVLAASVAVAGCDTPAENDDWTLGSADDGKGDGDITFPTLASRYALRLETRVHTRNKDNAAACAKNPQDAICSQVYSDNGVVLTGLVNVEQTEGGQVSLSEHLCNFRLTNHDSVSLDDKIWDHLPPVTYSGALNPKSGSFELTTDPGVYQLGVRLQNPLTDSFPTAGNDPRLSNDDQDDRVAVSVHLPLGRRIDFAARFIETLTGSLGSNGEWNGMSTSTTVKYDFMVFDDNIPFVDAHKSAIEALAKNEVLTQTMITRLVPLRDSPACAQAIAAVK